MKKFLPLVFFVLAGCAADEPAKPETTPAPKVESSTPTPVIKPKGNPNRVYQLDTLKKVDLKVNGKPVKAWVMDDEGKTQEGMMFLKDGDVKSDEGMLFVFDKLQEKSYPDGSPRGFWMHNTLIPLDIVFMSPKGIVINVGHGKVQDDTTVASEGDFQYVLELKAGTAESYGLKPGDTISIPKL